MKGGRTAVCRMESLRRGGICGHRQTSKHKGLGIPLQDWRFLLRASNDILPWEAPPRIDAVFFRGKLGTMRFEALTVSCIVQASSFNMSSVRPPLWHRLRGSKSDQLCAIPSWVTYACFGHPACCTGSSMVWASGALSARSSVMVI